MTVKHMALSTMALSRTSTKAPYRHAILHAASSAADSLRIIRWLGEDESEGIICSNWSGSDEEFPAGWIVTSSLAERFWVAKCSWWAVATLLRRMCRNQARKDSIVSPRKAPKSRDASR